MLPEPEVLDDFDVILMIRKRNVAEDKYEDYEEWNWKASPSAPTVDDLKKAVIEHKKFELDLKGIELAKFVTHEYLWLHIHESQFKGERRKVTTGGRGKRGKSNTLLCIYL